MTCRSATERTLITTRSYSVGRCFTSCLDTSPCRSRKGMTCSVILAASTGVGSAETITAVAIEFPERTWVLERPARHIDVIARRVLLTGMRGSGRQGFMTSAGRFVDRVIAAHIAYAAGQTVKLLPRLYSEDVW